jgi:predicted nucleotidyltransferase component of viral defense system
MLDQTTLKILAQTQEIDQYSIFREYLQIKFLNEFYKNKQLVQTYFKGGTALRLIFGSARFSEDLDFTTLIAIKKIKKTLAATVQKLKLEFTQLTLQKLETAQGYSAKLYVPVDFARQPLTIKLDFSTRESVLEPITSPLATDLPIKGISLIEHLSKKELLAEKVRAILHRDQGRDLFDLWFLLHKKVKFDPKFINQKLQFYQESYHHDIFVNKIKSFEQKKLNDNKKFLPRSLRGIIPELKRLILTQLEIATEAD